MCSGNIHNTSAAAGNSNSTSTREMMSKALTDVQEYGGRTSSNTRDQQQKTSKGPTCTDSGRRNSSTIEVIPTTIELVEQRPSTGSKPSKSAVPPSRRRRASSTTRSKSKRSSSRRRRASSFADSGTVPRIVDVITTTTAAATVSTKTNTSADSGSGSGDGSDNNHACAPAHFSAIDDDVSSLGEPSAILDLPLPSAPTAVQARASLRRAESTPMPLPGSVSGRKPTRSSTLTSLRASRGAGTSSITRPYHHLANNTNIGATVESSHRSNNKPNLVMKNISYHHNQQLTDLEVEQQRSRKLGSVLKETRKMAEAAIAEVKRLQERNCALTTQLEEKTLEVSKLTERIQRVDDTIDRHHRAQRRKSLDSSIVADPPPDSGTCASQRSIDMSPQLLADLRNDLIAMERRLELEQKKRVESSNVEAELRNRIILLETENLKLKKDKDLLSVKLEDHQEAVANSSDASSKMKMKRSSLPDQTTCDSIPMHDQDAPSAKRSSLPARLDDDSVSDEDEEGNEGNGHNAGKAKQMLLDIVDDTRSMASRSMRNLYQGLVDEEKASSTTLATTRSTSRTRSRSPISANDQPFKSHPWRHAGENEPSDEAVSEGYQQESTCTEDVDLTVAPASLGKEWTEKLKGDEETPVSARRRDSERSLGGSTGRPGSSLGSIFEDDVYDDDISLDINDTLEEKAQGLLREHYFQDECHTSVQSLPAIIVHTGPHGNGVNTNKISMHRSFSSNLRYQHEQDSKQKSVLTGMHRRSGSFGSLGNISIGRRGEMETKRGSSTSFRRSSSET